MNKKTTAATRACVLFGLDVVPAKIAIEIIMPTAANIISFRRPNRSYSVLEFSFTLPRLSGIGTIVKSATNAPIGCMTSLLNKSVYISRSAGLLRTTVQINDCLAALRRVGNWSTGCPTNLDRSPWMSNRIIRTLLQQGLSSLWRLSQDLAERL